MALHISHGGADDLLDLGELSVSGATAIWTINSRARAGDDVLFYITAPTSALMASGEVRSAAVKEDDPDSDWFGHYVCEVGGIRLLAAPPSLEQMKQAYPEWGWLRSPVMSTTVPETVAGELRKGILEGPMGLEPEVEQTVLEGRQYLATHLRRERNATLSRAKRADVLHRTGALRCEACDFSFLDRYGPNVGDFCEVHHLTPLGGPSDHVETTLADLAILCANCHRATHRIQPMPTPPELRSLLRGA